MLSEELAKEIIADYKNVEAKTKHLLKKVRRVVVRSKGKRFQKLVEYKSPEKMIGFYVLIFPIKTFTVHLWSTT